MTRLAVTPANIITFHNVSRQTAEVNFTFVWKENVLMREHILVTSFYVSIAEYIYKHWLKWLHHQVPLVVKLWSNMLECITQISADHFHTDSCSDCSMESARAAHITVQNIGWLLQGESSTLPCEKACFPQYKRTILYEDGLLNHCRDHVITDSSLDPCCLFMHSHACY